LGYDDMPELTAERFSEPDSEGCRTYRTGDLARRLPDGQLVFLGRLDDQVKLRGVRIEPAEIEAVMVKLPDVEAAAVLLHQDGYTGGTQLAAYYSGAAENSAIRSALKQSLPDFMVPAAIMQIKEIPLTPNGKLDRKRLPEPRWERDAAADFVAPRSATEKQLSAIWSDVLGVSEVSVHDDFFDLGGHSLLAAQLAARMNESMQVVVPLRRLFDAPTVAQIAEHIDTLQWAVQGQEG
jgi:acyl carrier protein